MKDKKEKKMDWSLLIAIIALILSGLIFFQDHLKPFNLSTRASGRAVIAKNPYTEDLKQDCLLVNMIFSNSGSRRGVIEDIALCLNYKNEKIILRSFAVKKDRTLNVTKGLPPPQLETFLSFNLGKGESNVKEIMFIPLEKESSFSFEDQLYNADIWVLSSKDWEKHKPFSFLLTKEDIESISNPQFKKFEDGSRFIKWTNRDKPLASIEKQLSELEKLIGK
jgi:hypothetical protein